MNLRMTKKHYINNSKYISIEEKDCFIFTQNYEIVIEKIILADCNWKLVKMVFKESNSDSSLKNLSSDESRVEYIIAWNWKGATINLPVIFSKKQ
jgi:hypothetical protein